MGIRETLVSCGTRMCAALRQALHVEKEPPSIREALANVESNCAWSQGESHILRTGGPNLCNSCNVLNECARR
eukprot:1286666-Pyramimonas_sp.AAC.1